MAFWLAVTAALGTAVCNGFAAILQKMGADKHVAAGSGHVGVFLKLFRDWPYLAGSVLDLAAWVLTLIAVQSLPLFVVQPITALSVVITVWVERVFFRRRLGRATTVSIVLILAGVALLASCATTQASVQVGQAARMAIITSPLALLAGGLLFIRNTKHHATIILASLSGIAFGATAITGRILSFRAPYWHILYNPLFLALLAYGLVGLWMFVIALQRHHATVVNAAMISFETIIPTVVGITILGDRPAGDSWGLVIAGVTLAMAGTLLITRKQAAIHVGTPARTPESLAAD